MSRKLLSSLISKMYLRLSKIIEENKYDLLSSEVLKYSRRLDRVLHHYNKTHENNLKVVDATYPDKVG